MNSPFSYSLGTLSSQDGNAKEDFDRKNEFLPSIRISKIAAFVYCPIRHHNSTSAKRLIEALSSKWKLK